MIMLMRCAAASLVSLLAIIWGCLVPISLSGWRLLLRLGLVLTLLCLSLVSLFVTESGSTVSIVVPLLPTIVAVTIEFSWLSCVGIRWLSLIGLIADT